MPSKKTSLDSTRQGIRHRMESNRTESTQSSSGNHPTSHNISETLACISYRAQTPNLRWPVRRSPSRPRYPQGTKAFTQYFMSILTTLPCSPHFLLPLSRVDRQTSQGIYHETGSGSRPREHEPDGSYFPPRHDHCTSRHTGHTT
jgi:hypothetical protein